MTGRKSPVLTIEEAMNRYDSEKFYDWMQVMIGVLKAREEQMVVDARMEADSDVSRERAKQYFRDNYVNLKP